jgi:ribosomal protein S18 acetylase RimI-like enzyme
MITIRSLEPREYRRATELRNSEKPFPYLPDAFSHIWDLSLELTPRALWAIEVGGDFAAVAGYALSESDPKLGLIGLIVRPEYRRCGIGAYVYTAMVEKLRARGVQCLLTRIYAKQLAGQRFVAQRGFRAVGSSIICRLDVAAADLTAWDDPAAMLARQGLRFASLDHFPRQHLADRLLPLWNRTRPDQPQAWPYIPYRAQRLEREMLEPAEMALAHSFVVVDADQRFVALTLNAYAPDSGLFTVYSAVDPDFRRRKLATALKLKLLTSAQRHQIDFLIVENETSNTAMRRINHQLGYRPLLNLVMYRQSLVT